MAEKLFPQKYCAVLLGGSRSFTCNIEESRPLEAALTRAHRGNGGRYSNPDNDSRGSWKSGDLSARNYYSEGTYAITCPSGRVIDGPPPGTYWRYSEKNFKELDRDGRIWWGK